MLPEKHLTNNTNEREKKFVTVIHPEQITTTTSKERENNSASLVSWLFLIGSLIFLADGILELTEGISIHAIFHNLASLLFTIGSIFFLLDAQTK